MIIFSLEREGHLTARVKNLLYNIFISNSIIFKKSYILNFITQLFEIQLKIWSSLRDVDYCCLSI